MRRIILVMRHEIITTVTRKSFLFTAFGVPIISTLILFGVSLLNRNAPNALNQVLGSGGQIKDQNQGYVDLSGIIKVMPPSASGDTLQAYPSVTAARQALSDGKINGYYVISKDYLHTGEITLVEPEFNPLNSFESTNTLPANRIQYYLNFNLLGGDIRLANRVAQPMNLETTLLEPEEPRDQDNPMTFFLPYAVTMIFYITILMSSSLLLNSVTKEKETRVVEILMSTITPRQMLSGKIIGLGVVGLLQTVLWVGTGYGLLRLSGRTFSIPAVFQLPPSFLAWGLLFFLLGYAVYASLMAAVGALVPNLREASQATFVVIMPMLIPLLTISVLIEKPDGLLAIALSLFPLTSPVAMMTRLAATTVSLWQIFLAVLLLAGTVLLIIRSVANMFRAQTLLSGQPFKLQKFLGALGGRM
jgi:ABC-2 type transport system permease protein